MAPFRKGVQGPAETQHAETGYLQAGGGWGEEHKSYFTESVHKCMTLQAREEEPGGFCRLDVG
jgi:hypothetical protein